MKTGLQDHASTRPRDSEILVKVENVAKKFCRSLKRSLWYGVRDMAHELNPLSKNGTVTSSCRPPVSSSLRKDEFWAVKDASFELRRGECLGLLGRNGAGKTTLLKMLNGLMKPDRGRITVRGRVGALIALGAGFNPILTGRENVYVNGSVLGLSKREVDEKFEEIVEFAEIGEFIDSPVRSYSSGMNVRLGFAVATALRPDILLVDEVLAVGDLNFRTKCYDRLEKIRGEVAIILVSHNRQDIARVSTRVIVMRGGEVGFSGKVAEGITAYEEVSGSGAGLVRAHEGLELLYAKVEPGQIECGDGVDIRLGVAAAKEIEGVTFRLSIMDHAEQGLAEWRSEQYGPPLKLARGENHFSFRVNSIRLKSGSYFCNFILSKPLAAQYLLLALRHQRLNVSSHANALIPYQL